MDTSTRLDASMVRTKGEHTVEGGAVNARKSSARIQPHVEQPPLGEFTMLALRRQVRAGRLPCDGPRVCARSGASPRLQRCGLDSGEVVECGGEQCAGDFQVALDAVGRLPRAHSFWPIIGCAHQG